ncbi:hypothetical protein HPOKI128_05530 [Helicobacter pylori oki128]|nr:hypothetical protein HPOKI128_05530 [Helicobacter pylori oki128]
MFCDNTPFNPLINPLKTAFLISYRLTSVKLFYFLFKKCFLAFFAFYIHHSAITQRAA